MRKFKKVLPRSDVQATSRSSEVEEEDVLHASLVRQTSNINGRSTIMSAPPSSISHSIPEEVRQENKEEEEDTIISGLTYQEPPLYAMRTTPPKSQSIVPGLLQGLFVLAQSCMQTNPDLNTAKPK